MGSLLEVGTGFHPELTGRENIYLNGAILGMQRAEIDRRFDEIVAFSEIERFLDTPVKRYSSGMYVRLAFAVAAHLEPEILIVDEVLAVGDAEFQKKCLGKMGEVAGEGRTVMFVSHNMAAVESLCPRSMLLSDGQLQCDDRSLMTISRYVSPAVTGAGAEVGGMFSFADAPDTSSGSQIMRRMRLVNELGHTTSTFQMGRTMFLELDVVGLASMYDSECVAAFSSSAGQRVFTTDSRMSCVGRDAQRSEREIARLCLTDLPLTPGRYWIDSLGVYARSLGFVEYRSRAGWFDVIEGDVYGKTGYRVPPEFGLVYVHGAWEMQNAEPTR